eukprot:SAG11_NODE_494_length_8948_cov_2.882699_9_plen_167_part_00
MAGSKIRQTLPPHAPPVNLEDDWSLMLGTSAGGSNKLQWQGQPEGAGTEGHCAGVSFPMFESWWKLRAGLGEGDMPVIPEYIAERVCEEHAGRKMVNFMGAQHDFYAQDEEVCVCTNAMIVLHASKALRDGPSGASYVGAVQRVGRGASTTRSDRGGTRQGFCAVR